MDIIYLPEPQLDLESKLMDAIVSRRTNRKLENRNLSMQQISDIVFVAAGETKGAKGRAKNKRTVASACNSKKMTLMVALKSGVYSYNEADHSLLPVVDKDVRADMVRQKMLKNNALGLIYIGRRELRTGVIRHDAEMNALLAGCELGAMSQNVYLYCAVNKLNTVLMALYNRKMLSSILNLEENHEVVLVQVVG